ncbi:hypothetical protein KC19_5G100900 [Ceratodon purpureus]|uniref:Secreted protein n=1 Tax=Ceratodon purpureus TaxID=3225 RepID=A0A8T0I188_CERPU|nr:hypothetical protein KC19_5G100900 [Ceratodon purpureus]
MLRFGSRSAGFPGGCLLVRFLRVCVYWAEEQLPQCGRWEDWNNGLVRNSAYSLSKCFSSCPVRKINLSLLSMDE